METYKLGPYTIPFPPSDLWTALAAVALFIPAVVLINALVNGVMNLFSSGKPKAKAQ